jgi:cytochrome c biogenesis protein CcdA
MSGSCSSPGCYLGQNGGLVSLPLVTIAGLVDSLNPCAIGMIILLLGYLVVFAQKPKKVLPLGLLYLAVVYFTYLGIGLFFYQAAQRFSLGPARLLFNKVLGGGLLAAGLINLKDSFFPQSPVHLEIPQKARPGLLKLVEKTSVLTTVVLAFLVTLLETPCSLPIYAGTATLLANSGLNKAAVLAYFLYYNLLFILPLLLIVFLFWQGVEVVKIKEWEHKFKGKGRLAMGLLLLAMGAWLLFG